MTKIDQSITKTEQIPLFSLLLEIEKTQEQKGTLSVFFSFVDHNECCQRKELENTGKKAKCKAKTWKKR